MTPSRYSTTITRMTITTMVTKLVPLMRDLRMLDSGQMPGLEKAREQQNGDYHQDDHHQYVNQVARPHAPTSLSTHRLQGRPQNDQYEKDHYKDSDYCAERPVYPP